MDPRVATINLGNKYESLVITVVHDTPNFSAKNRIFGFREASTIPLIVALGEFELFKPGELKNN
jgi:hypothetical protein